MNNYTSFNELAAANMGEPCGGQDLSVFNMGSVGTLRSGRGLYIHPDDHGNPHVDVMQGKIKLAKIFIQPEIALDPAVPCKLSRAERDEAFAMIAKNLTEYKQKWNQIQQHNPAAQPAILDD